ncbi:hypothetical protein BOX15_Mlig011082g1, partial [Macrostomum lignano]
QSPQALHQQQPAGQRVRKLPAWMTDDRSDVEPGHVTAKRYRCLQFDDFMEQRLPLLAPDRPIVYIDRPRQLDVWCGRVLSQLDSDPTGPAVACGFDIEWPVFNSDQGRGQISGPNQGQSQVQQSVSHGLDQSQGQQVVSHGIDQSQGQQVVSHGIDQSQGQQVRSHDKCQKEPNISLSQSRGQGDGLNSDPSFKEKSQDTGETSVSRTTFFSLTQDGRFSRTALLQLCPAIEPPCAVLIHFARGGALTQPTPTLNSLLTHPRLVKVGLCIQGDLKKLCRDFPEQISSELLLKPSGWVELNSLAKQRLKLSTQWSLNGLVQHLLDSRLDKDRSIRCCDWAAVPLTAERRRYAALDAIASLLIYESLAKR